MCRTRAGIALAVLSLCALPAWGQSFRVQCPDSTVTHTASTNNSEPPYNGPTQYTTNTQGFVTPTAGTANGAIKCQQISGGDGYAIMADGTQEFMFSFGPLSGLADIAAGLPGSEPPLIFNETFQDYAKAVSATNNVPVPGDPATTDGASDNGTTYAQGGSVVNGVWSPPASGAFSYNGAIGLTPDIPYIYSIYDISEGVYPDASGHGYPLANTVTVLLNTQSPFSVGDKIVISGQDTGGFNGTYTVTAPNVLNTIFAAKLAFRRAVSGDQSGTIRIWGLPAAK